MSETFGNAGERLRLALEMPGDGFDVGVLIVEACRIADRLDQLARILDGDTDIWARIVTARDGDLELRIDSGMQEARQQAGTLRQLLAEIRRQRGAPETSEADDLADL